MGPLHPHEAHHPQKYLTGAVLRFLRAPPRALGGSSSPIPNATNPPTYPPGSPSNLESPAATVPRAAHGSAPSSNDKSPPAGLIRSKSDPHSPSLPPPRSAPPRPGQAVVNRQHRHAMLMPRFQKLRERPQRCHVRIHGKAADAEIHTQLANKADYQYRAAAFGLGECSRRQPHPSHTCRSKSSASAARCGVQLLHDRLPQQAGLGSFALGPSSAHPPRLTNPLPMTIQTKISRIAAPHTPASPRSPAGKLPG